MTNIMLSAEELRILTAVAAGRMGVNEYGRYVIAGDARPDRRAREALLRRGLIDWPDRASSGRSRLTALGREVLDGLS